MHSAHYLESLDSVRSGWADLAVGSPEALKSWAAHEVEILFEVLVALAYGRDVIVPATYAFDSLGFLAVAPQVLASRDRAAESTRTGAVDSPFRPNLLPNERFDEVVARYVRAADGFTFVSSAFPELHELTLAEREEVAGSSAQLKQHTSREVGASTSGPFDRAGALDQVTRELCAARPALRKDTLRMNDLLRSFAADSADIRELAVALGDTSAQTYDFLLAAVRQLIEADHGLNSRSPVHSDLAWAKTGGLAIEKIADDELLLAALREFMDSLYNAVVFSSTPAESGLFSTKPSLSSPDSISRLLAQNLAVITGLGATALGSTIAEDETTPPGFRLSAPDSITALSAGVAEAKQGILGALDAVFEDRLEPRGDFWPRVDVLNRKLRLGGMPARDALSEYNEALARRISSHLHAKTEPGRILTFTTIGFGAVQAVLSGYQVVPAVFAGTAALVGMAGPHVVLQGSRGKRARADRRWWSESLSTAVNVGHRR
jgi:hypothetical protein